MPDFTKLLGVNWIDPVLRRKQNDPARAPNPQWIKDKVDNIVSRKMNAIRIPIYMETLFQGSTYSPANVITHLTALASYCESKGIYSYVEFHQFANNDSTDVGSSSSPGGGGGLPAYLVAGQNAMTFYDNIWSTTNEPPIWNEIFNKYWLPILNAIDSYQFVLGYELFNEPPLYRPAHWQGLVNFNTAMAQKIRAWGSQKYILFV